jgi:excinuclease ABC subunit C
MQFEEAARQHKRLEKVVRRSSSCATNWPAISTGCTASPSWPPPRPMRSSCGSSPAASLQAPARFGFEVEEGKPVSLDRKLREMAETLAPRQASVRDRQESLALLARWYYSTWRDGEWLPFDDFSAIPYRKLVNAISRVAHGAAGEAQ